MKISLNWLKDFVTFDKNLSIEEMTWRITEATSEIERVHRIEDQFKNMVVGEITKVEAHPDADRLRVTEVNIGSEKLQVVCGGSNLDQGMKIAFALPGAMVRWHGEGELVEIKQVKIRGVESTGMICAADEIGLEKLVSHGDGEICDLSHLKAKPGTGLAEALEINDVVFEVDNHAITHRPDLFSHYGMARECVALGIAKWKQQYPDYNLKKMAGSKPLPFKVSFANDQIVKEYHGTIVENLDSRPSPAWMQARLFACGIRAINALVDITNYVMLEAGAPMHAFDRESITDDEFQFRLSKKGEKMKTLDGKEQQLFADIMVVENGGKIVDLVGIMGGENSEVTEKTTSVYYHQGIYNPVWIRKAMIGLGQRTDAGTIYEKGPYPELSQLGLGRTLELTQQIFPDAKFSYQIFMEKPVKNKPTSVKLNHEKIASHLGIEIPPKSVERILSDLGCEVKTTGKTYTVHIPAWRRESLETNIDLIEELGRINGYSNVPANPPSIELKTPHKNPKRLMIRTIQSYLIGQGFLEELNFSFVSKELLEKSMMFHEDQLIELANPVNEDFRFMRPDLLPSMLQNLSRNMISDPERSWRTFEKGAVFAKNGQAVHEHGRMTFICSSPQEGAFYQAKGLAEQMMKELSLSLSTAEAKHHAASVGRVLDLQVQEKRVGVLYELHPLLKQAFKLKGSVAIVEIELDQITELAPEKVKFQAINRNPAAYLDINVMVDRETYVRKIEDIIHSVQPEFLQACQLIDVYEGQNLGEGKKSFTFSLKYQHPERTLEDQEIQSVLDQLIKKLEASGGTVRR